MEFRLGCGGGPGQSHGMLCDRGAGGFAFARDLHGRASEFDTVPVKTPF
jgi:hypothetical protein